MRWARVSARSSSTSTRSSPIDDAAPFRPGAWYDQTLDRVDHLDVIAFPQHNQVRWQEEFYQALFDRLARLEVAYAG
ncbi:MAG TPA: hypothetical protein VE127_16675 [Solirubrobacteraceae bacterium]|nr:hypothetical protein [Solirubrobacteraceae bacterium]